MGGDDAVVHADASVCVSGEGEAGVLRFSGVDGIQHAAVAQAVLRDAPGVPVNPDEAGVGVDIHHGMNVTVDNLQQFGVGEVHGFGVARAANHRAQKNPALFREAGKDGGGPDAAERAFFLVRGNQESESVERSADGVYGVGGTHDGERGLFDGCERATEFGGAILHDFGGAVGR